MLVQPRPLLYDQKVLQKLNQPEALIILNFCKLHVGSSEEGSVIKEGLFNSSAENKISFGQTMKTLRLALAGSLKGPDLFKMIEIIGAEETIKRIDKLTKTLKP